MIRRLLLLGAALWPTLGMSGMGCLATGCASDIMVGPSRFSVYSLDFGNVGATPTGGPVERPLWNFAFSTTQMSATWHWDGVAIAKKGIEDVGEIVGTLVDTLAGWLPFGDG